MECHSIQFTTISINVERGIVKILFKYRYFQDLLIDIDIDISQILLIDIDIDIDIFKNDHIDIDIFQKCRYIDNRYVISIYRTGLPGGRTGLDAETVIIKGTVEKCCQEHMYFNFFENKLQIHIFFSSFTRLNKQFSL